MPYQIWAAFLALSLAGCRQVAPAQQRVPSGPGPGPVTGQKVAASGALPSVSILDSLARVRDEAFPGADVVRLKTSGHFSMIGQTTSSYMTSYCGVLEGGAFVCWKGPSECAPQEPCGDLGLPESERGCGPGEIRKIQGPRDGVTRLIYGCALTNGEVWCRDSDAFNFQRVLLATDAQDIQGNWRRGCALLDAQTVACWVTSMSDVRVPAQRVVQVENLDHVVSLSTRGHDACAQLEDGNVYCWHPGNSIANRIFVDSPISIHVNANKLCTISVSGQVMCGSLSGKIGETVMDVVEAPAATRGVHRGQSLCFDTVDGDLWCAGRPYPEKGVLIPKVQLVGEIQRLGVLDCVTRGKGMACWNPAQIPIVVEQYSILDASGRCVIGGDRSVYCFESTQACPKYAY